MLCPTQTQYACWLKPLIHSFQGQIYSFSTHNFEVVPWCKLTKVFQKRPSCILCWVACIGTSHRKMNILSSYLAWTMQVCFASNLLHLTSFISQGKQPSWRQLRWNWCPTIKGQTCKRLQPQWVETPILFSIFPLCRLDWTLARLTLMGLGSTSGTWGVKRSCKLCGTNIIK